jgi:16S rRNA processing protein RimM
MTPPQAPARLRVAQVLRTHGVRGEVRVEPLGGDAERFAPGLRLHVDGDAQTLVVRSARAQGEQVLLSFEGIDAAERAAALRGAYLSVDGAEARSLAPGEWFVWQLIGLEARDQDGNVLGEVTDVEPGIASDVLVVSKGGDVMRFPMVTAFVAGIDVQRGLVTLTPWETEP